MNTPTKQQAQVAFSVLEGIHNSGLQAEAMSTDELTRAVAGLQLEGGERVASLESAVKGEAIHRLSHPFTWRLERCVTRLKRKWRNRHAS